MVRAQTWELGGGAGAAGYMGDLNPNNPVKVSGYSISGFAKRNFDGYWSLKINYTYGTIAGREAYPSGFPQGFVDHGGKDRGRLHIAQFCVGRVTGHGHLLRRHAHLFDGGGG